MLMTDLPYAGHDYEKFRRSLTHYVSKIQVIASNGNNVADVATKISLNFEDAINWIQSESEFLPKVNLRFAGHEYEDLRNDISYYVSKCVRESEQNKVNIQAMLGAAMNALLEYVEPSVEAPVYIGDDNALSYFLITNPELPSGVISLLTVDGFGAAVQGSKVSYVEDGSNFIGQDVVVTTSAKIDETSVTLPYTILNADIGKVLNCVETGTNAGGSATGTKVPDLEVLDLDLFPSPATAEFTGAAGKITVEFTQGAKPASKFRVRVFGAAGDGSASAGDYEFTTVGPHDITVPAGTYPCSITNVWNSVGRCVLDSTSSDIVVS